METLNEKIIAAYNSRVIECDLTVEEVIFHGCAIPNSPFPAWTAVYLNAPNSTGCVNIECSFFYPAEPPKVGDVTRLRCIDDRLPIPDVFAK